jgi:preprotein translocase SecE subunit
MGASMANVTRIKAKDSSSDKSGKSEDAEISRKVSIKAKNSENTKLKKANKEAVKAKAKAIRKEKHTKEKSEMPLWLKPLWFISTPFRAIGRYFRNSFRELRQVRWPNRTQTWKITFSVILYVVIIAVAIMLLDVLLTFLFDKFIGGNN